MIRTNMGSAVVPHSSSKRTRQRENLNELFVHLEQVEEEIEALKLFRVELQNKIAAKQTAQLSRRRPRSA